MRFRAYREGSSVGLRAPKSLASEAGVAGHPCLTIKDVFHLDGLTREYVERVLRGRVGGGGASIRVVDEFPEEV